MKRQLREGGGIMNTVPRDKFFLGKVAKAVKKTVKKVAGGIGDILSSDIGKAALLGYGAYKLGPMLGSKMALPEFLTSKTAKNIGIGLAGSLLGGVMTKAQEGDEEAIEATRNVDSLKTYLRQGYRNLKSFVKADGSEDAEALEAQVNRDVSEYSSGAGGYAEGGRIGFAEGTYKDFEEFMMRRSESMSERQKEELRKQFEMYMRSKDPTVEAAEGGRIGFADGPVLPPDPTQPVNPFAPKPPADAPVLPDRMASNMENDKILEALFEKYLDMGLSPEKAAEKAREEFDRMSMMKTEGRGLAAIGGKMDTASDNAMQAAGIEGLPIRQNPKGVKELDLRETGGFIQPVGIKEKEDDIPAMLSNNEFVFTADAVRGMGEGDVNKGAERMYNMMKTLEAGGRV